MTSSSALKNADWLQSPALHRVFDALQADGGVARIAGGAVRDGLLGLPVNDIDIATTETPEQVIKLARKAGLTTHPTGLQHGTVTVVADGSPFEVTTLRVDEETDGRHATVSYTDDWQLDADRRDFTINALFCEPDGTVVDLVGGLDDLKALHIRFVGNAADRISEDYLRILRFFRFTARYSEGPMDGDALKACIDAKEKLSTLARERIRQELLKLLVARNALQALEIMIKNGILEILIQDLFLPDRFAHLSKIEAKTDIEPDPIRRLAALCSKAEAAALQEELVLSNAQADQLKALAQLPPISPAFRDAERQTLLYWHGREAVIDKLLLSWSDSEAAADDKIWRGMLQAAQDWAKPDFPMSGKDLLAAGIPQGVELGRCLQALEDWWIASGFTANKGDLIKRLAAIRN